MLEEEENAMLFNNNTTDPNSIDGDYNTTVPNK